MRRTLLLGLLAAAAGTAFLLSNLLTEEVGRSAQPERPPPPIDAPPRAPPGEKVPEPAGEARSTDFRMFGTVREEGGGGIEGAFVRPSASVEPARTGADGAYELRTPVDPAAFAVYAEGFLPILGLDRVVPGEARVDFALRPAAQVVGRVATVSGAPVRGATVYVLRAEEWMLDAVDLTNGATTDAEGRFALFGVPKGTYDVGARGPGILPALRRDVVVPERGQVHVELAVRQGRNVEVTVRNGVGARVFCADSRLRTFQLPPGGVEALATGFPGRAFVDYPVLVSAELLDEAPIRLAGVPDGAVDLWASAPGKIAEPGTGRVLGTLSPVVELALLDGAVVKLEVRDSTTGTPLEPEVRRETEGLREPIPVERTDGACVLPADDRRHRLLLALPGYETATVEVGKLDPTAPAPLLKVLMTREPSPGTGRFLLDFGDPAFRGRVACVGLDASGKRVWYAHALEPDREGRWSIEGVPVGTYAVNVLATGKVPAAIPRVVVTETLRETHRVTLSDGGGVRLAVRDAAGELLDNVHLLLLDASGAQIDVQVLSMMGEQRGFVSVNWLPSAAVAASDSGLAPGEYTLTVGKEGYAPDTARFTIRGTEVAEVNLVLRRR